MNLYKCCKGCGKRHPLCHKDCPEKAKIDAQIEELRKEKRKQEAILDYKRTEHNKRTRRRNLKK